MPIHEGLREFIESLNSTEVEYLIVGAYAVAWHGHPRFTADIDIFVRPVPSNADAVLAALQAFGFGSLDITRQDLIQKDQVIQLGARPNRIALITSISGVDFETAWAGCCPGLLDGVPVRFIGVRELVLNKESTGRPKDLGDADELRKRNPGI